MATEYASGVRVPASVIEVGTPLPVRVQRYELRRGSGGPGKQRGGDGLTRAIEFLAPARVTLLSERREIAPYGLAGGEPGACGLNLLKRADDAQPEKLPGKTTFGARPGDLLTLQTPGGGGWGSPDEED